MGLLVACDFIQVSFGLLQVTVCRFVNQNRHPRVQSLLLIKDLYAMSSVSKDRVANV